jgi:ribonuclease BN (tRNA processing enzyme)
MKIKVIGCGNAFSNENFNQSFLLEENGRKLLIDCGYQVQAALKHSGYKVTDIDDIYVSHPHADHIGCLEWFAFNRYDWMTLPKPRIFKDFKMTKAPVLYCEAGLMQSLWDKSLSGGLESMEGFTAKLDTFFDTRPIDVDEGFDWQGYHFKLIQQIHIMAGSKFMPTYGLLIIKEGHKTVYFTTDSQHCSPSQVEVFYNEADLIFQDCELTPFFSNVHANYLQLAGHDEANSRKLDKSIRNKMWLSHYQDFYNHNQKMVVGKTPYSFYQDPEKRPGVNFIEFGWDAQALFDGFAGFIKLGQEFEI